MQYEVQTRDVGPQLLAAARGHGHAHDFVPRLFALLDEVWRFLRAHPEIQPGHNVFLYCNEVGKDLFRTEQGLPIEAGVQVAAPFEGSGNVACSATPGGRVATVTHIGPYEKLSAAYAAGREWCQQNHVALAGPSWEVYGDWNEDADQLRTDIFWLLK